MLGVLPEYLGVDRHQSVFAPFDTAATLTVGLQRLKGHHRKIYFKKNYYNYLLLLRKLT